MADNWLQFSEVIPNLTAEEEAWINGQLEAVAVVDGKEYPYELGDAEIDADGKKISAEKTEFAGCRAYRDMADYDVDQYGWQVGFSYRFQDDHDQPDGWGRHLWLYADEGSELDLVAHLVQKFLRKFRPHDCWSLTYATTCSKPRVGEFGGGAVFVTSDEIKWQNSYDFVENCRRAFHEQPDVPRLVKRAQDLGIEPHELDDAVHDAASTPASEINNCGLEEQIAFLVEQNGTVETERLIELAGAERNSARG